MEKIARVVANSIGFLKPEEIEKVLSRKGIGKLDGQMEKEERIFRKYREEKEKSIKFILERRNKYLLETMGFEPNLKILVSGCAGGEDLIIKFPTDEAMYKKVAEEHEKIIVERRRIITDFFYEAGLSLEEETTRGIEIMCYPNGYQTDYWVPIFVLGYPLMLWVPQRYDEVNPTLCPFEDRFRFASGDIIGPTIEVIPQDHHLRKIENAFQDLEKYFEKYLGLPYFQLRSPNNIKFEEVEYSTGDRCSGC